MKTSLITAALAIAALAAALSLGACTLSVSPDGTRNWSLSGEEAARAIIIYTK
jgi:uncharacterized membrane protein